MRHLVLAMVVVALALTLAPVTTAQEHDESEDCLEISDEACEFIDKLVSMKGASVPFIIPRQSIIDISVNESVIGHVHIAGGALSSVVCCQTHPNATHSVSIKDFSVVDALSESENPVDAIDQALSSEEIVFSATSIQHRARLVVGRALIKISSWFV